jgi:uncharacterized membrane protein
VDDLTIARALHILAVVLWIGGVAFATTVLLPAVRNIQAPERVVFFENVERRFGAQPRFTTVLAGLTGIYMVVRLDISSASCGLPPALISRPSSCPDRHRDSSA